MEAWDGTKWSVQAPATPPMSNGYAFAGISCPLASQCTAVGSYSPSHPKTYTQKTLGEGWNGATWTVESTANPS